jgi:hypothetical protein
MTLNSWEIFLQIVNRGGYSNTRQEISNPTKSYFSPLFCVELNRQTFKAYKTTLFVHSSTRDLSAGASAEHTISTSIKDNLQTNDSQ